MISPDSLNLFALPWLPLEARAAFPHQPAIYFAIDSEGAVQYIGRSVNPKSRWCKHHRYEDLAEIGGVKIAYLFIDNVELLPDIESALINWFDPPLNEVKPLSNSSAARNIKWRLAAVMADREIDYRELAKKADLHPVTINRLKNTFVLPPRIESATIYKICKALECQPGDLMRITLGE